jgi:hypothetical protein
MDDAAAARPARSVNQFILECSEAASRLDRVSTRDAKAVFAAALALAKQEYRALLQQRDLLPLTPQDAPLVQIMLDNLKARLKFLEKRV